MKHRIIDLCGREVAVRDAVATDGGMNTMYRGINLSVCADCKRESELVITELDPIENTRQPRVWGWCGKCDIGG